MSNTQTGVKAADDAVAKLKAKRQAGVAGATQANVTAAEVTFFQGVIATLAANGASNSAHIDALRSLMAERPGAFTTR